MNGGLPPPRLDQVHAPTPRTVQPGQRVLQVANNKTGLPLTVQISIPSSHQGTAVAGDNATVTLIPAANNVNGLLLWTLAISSVVASSVAPAGVTTGEDVVRGTGGTTYLSVVNSAAGVGVAVSNLSQIMWGFPVAAGFGLNLITAPIAAGHTATANVSYSLL